MFCSDEMLVFLSIASFTYDAEVFLLVSKCIVLPRMRNLFFKL
jgi:hypothetical protein